MQEFRFLAVAPLESTAVGSERQPGPEADEDGRLGVVLGGIENLQVRRQVEPGGDGRVVKQFHAVLAADPVDRQDRQVADSEMIIADADRVVLATADRAVPHQRQIGEPADRIRVPVGQAEVAVEGPVASRVVRDRRTAPDRIDRSRSRQSPFSEALPPRGPTGAADTDSYRGPSGSRWNTEIRPCYAPEGQTSWSSAGIHHRPPRHWRTTSRIRSSWGCNGYRADRN